MARYVLTFIVLGILTIFVLLAPQGLLTPPKYSEGNFGPYLVAYEELHGKDAVPDSAMERVRDRLAHAGVAPGSPFVLYLRDPARTTPDSLKALAGSLVHQEDSARAASLIPEFHLARIDTLHALSAEFPYRGSPSEAIGAWKVHDRLRRRAEKRGYQWEELLEIHNTGEEKTLYLVPRLGLDIREVQAGEGE